MSTSFEKFARHKTLSPSESEETDSEPETVKQQKPKMFRIDFSKKEAENSGGFFLSMEKLSEKAEKSSKFSVDEERVKELMKKSVITRDFNRLHPSEFCETSQRAAKRLRKKIRGETAGKGWDDMPATELTDERKRDLEVLMMRDALDPKSHYKKPDREIFPKYFQVGRIIEDRADYYSSRMTKKERKRTIVEELMADHELIAKNRHRFDEIQRRKALTRRGTFRKGFISKKSKRKNKLKSN